MPRLESENILLRAPELSDLETLYNWENNTQVWQTGCTLAPFSKMNLSKYLETAQLDIFESKQLRLMIDLKNPEPKTIGAVDLFDFDSYNNRAGVGILIYSKDDRQKGYAFESLQLLKNYAFSILGLTQLFCNIAANNQASLKLFQKAGFEIVGLKKKWTRRGSKYEDEYFLQLLNPQQL